MGDAAVLLALDQQRVQYPAAIVDRDVAHHANTAGFGVDLDDRHVGPEWKRRVGPVEVALEPQRPRLQAIG